MSLLQADLEAFEDVPSAPPFPQFLSRSREGHIASLVREALAADNARRLLRTEVLVATIGVDDRAAIAAWLGGMLHRPPLESPDRAWAPMRELVEALWWDLADRSPDPLEPDALHPVLTDPAAHPWGEP